MIVATTGVLPVLIAVKLGILPVPLAASPIDGALLVQLNTVPGTVLLKLTAAVAAPAHNDWSAGWLTSGVGFTVMVKLNGKLTQVIPALV